MRVIVTGSRTWTDEDLLRGVLDDLLVVHGSLTVVHGACPTGADAMADAWAGDEIERGSAVTLERFPADWDRWGRSAGPRRNEAMVAAGAGLVVAFFQPRAANRGTRHCVSVAVAAGIPVRKFPQLQAQFQAVMW